MLYDPELKEAHQAIQDLNPDSLQPVTLVACLNELASVTMTILRALDHLQDRYLADINLLNATIRDNASQIQKALDHIHRK